MVGWIEGEVYRRLAFEGRMAVSACSAALSGLIQWDCAVTPAFSAEDKQYSQFNSIGR